MRHWKILTKRISVLLLTTLLASLWAAPAVFASGYSSTNLTTGTSVSGLTWGSIASSGSGKYLVAAENAGDIYTSSDYGAHWTNRTAGTPGSGLTYHRISMSYTGQYVTVTGSNGDLWTSSNYGATLTNRTASTALSGINWQEVAVSYSGKYQVASAFTDGVFKSSDYGAHWTNVYTGTALDGLGIVFVTISSDGKYLTANQGDTNIFGSQNGGASWSKLTTGALDGLDWYGVAASSNGNNIVATERFGDIYTSTDYGATWTNRTTSTALSGLDWIHSQSSPTGQYLVAQINNGGSIYVSRNYGATWTELTTGPLSSLYWVDAAVSASGQHVYAAAGGADIYDFNDPALAPAKPVLANISSKVAISGSVTVNVLTGASGYDVDTLAIVSGPSHGTAVDPPGDITYTPNKGYVGADSLVYRLCAPLDNTVCSQATLSFTVDSLANTGEPAMLSSVLGALLIALATFVYIYKRPAKA